MNAFTYLPTLAWCLLILVTCALVGYGQIIAALDRWVDRAAPKPGHSFECLGCAWCEA